MAKIFAQRTRDGTGCIAVSQCSDQLIHRLDDKIVAYSNPALAWQISRLSKRTFDDALEELSLKGVIYVLGKDLGYRLRSGLQTSIRKEGTLADIILELYEEVGENCQFGFVTGKGTKIALPVGTNINTDTKEYCSDGITDKKKAEINSRFYDCLIANLDKRLENATKPKCFASLGSILQNGAEIVRNRYRKAMLREETEDLVNSYAGSGYGFFGSILLKDKLSDYDHQKKEVIHRKKESLQEILDKEFMKNPSIIIKSFDGEEASYKIAKEIGGIAKKLRFSKYSVIEAGKKELDELFNQHTRIGKNIHPSLRKGTGIYWNKGIYIPEIIMSFAARPRYSKAQRISKEMWNLENIGAIEAQETTVGKGSTIGIMDTGVDYNHKELRHLFGEDKGWDFVDSRNDPMDQHGHGTHVSGIAAGLATGVATGTTLYALRVLDENGSGKLSSIIEAVSWAIDRKLQVLNLSLGSTMPSQIEYETFLAAKKNGILVCAAAGNESYGPSYPASYDCCLSVAAVDINNEHAEFSNVWETNFISAPGVSIYSSVPDNKYECYSGTSMATPHLAGVCAMAKSLRQIDNVLFRQIVEKTAMPLGDANDIQNMDKYGFGLIRADKLVQELKK